MKFAYRWIANGLAFYLGLYLVDTLFAPFSFIKKGWIAIVLAVLLGCVNSTNTPFRGYKTNRRRAFGFFGLTALANYLFMQIVASIGAPMSSNAIGLMFTAVWLTLLTAAMNHLIGFKPKKQPDVVTREHRLGDAARQRLARTSDKSREQRKRPKR